MTKLIVMCGLQCSGKSTEAERLAKEYNAIIISSDALRKENPEWKNDTVFKTLYTKMNTLLYTQNVILDATNITIKSRRQIFMNLKVDCEKICYIMNTPYNECLKRLRIRNQLPKYHFVPEEVLENYYKSFEIPFYEEGWNKIIIHNHTESTEGEDNLKRLHAASQGFNQQNKHHTQDLGTHMKTVGDYLKEHTTNTLLCSAGYYHDVGKLFTQTMGTDGNCHYYNHDSVGTYILLCEAGIYWGVDFSNNIVEWKYDEERTLQWLFYINYHMKLHNATTEKSIKKWKTIFGEKLYNELRTFEEADKFRG